MEHEPITITEAEFNAAMEYFQDKIDRSLRGEYEEVTKIREMGGSIEDEYGIVETMQEERYQYARMMKRLLETRQK